MFNIFHFHSLIGSTSVLKKGMPEESQAACLCALSKFNEVCDSLKTGDITVGDLWMIAGNRDRMQRLCRAVTSSGSKEGNSYDSLNILLQARLIEFRTFQDYKTMHLKICNWIPSQHCFIGELVLCIMICMTICDKLSVYTLCTYMHRGG